MQVLAHAGPPSAEIMERDRQEVQKRKQAKDAFIKLLLHIFFAVVLFCISYINKDQRGYLYKSHIDSLLYESSKYQYGFSKVYTLAYISEFVFLQVHILRTTDIKERTIECRFVNSYLQLILIICKN